MSRWIVTGTYFDAILSLHVIASSERAALDAWSRAFERADALKQSYSVTARLADVGTFKGNGHRFDSREDNY